ncbi:MAG: glycosyltransferase family 2 protein [Candidatus Omnitrophica bacterium]|nr:glycosyltransferase family 2 protein [Candidatus Omnitrophota bacterium]
MACDIIVTVYDNVELTKRCLESVLKNFRQQDTVLLVDNGSAEATGVFLRQFCRQHQGKDIQIIRLSPNQGYIRAANAGLGRSRKEFACLLSNDTVVTAGWLDEIESLFAGHRDIGIIGPSSNTYGLHPGKGMGPEEFSRSLVKDAGTFVDVASCVGFCMAVRREVIQRIGVLDEAFGHGYFEDTDYCRRAQAAGFRCVISKASYVWHREHSTFADDTRKKLFEKNKRLFEERWGAPKRFACILEAAAFARNDFGPAIGLYLSLARKGHWLWVVADPGVPRDVLDSLRQHGNIRTIVVGKQLVALRAILLVLAKQKKKIDAVYICPGMSRLKKTLLRVLCARPLQELTYD